LASRKALGKREVEAEAGRIATTHKHHADAQKPQRRRAEEAKSHREETPEAELRNDIENTSGKQG
jgi:hypothetical protein